MEPQEPKTDKPLSSRDRAAIKDELISESVAGCKMRTIWSARGDVHAPQGRRHARPAGGRDDFPPRARTQREAEGQN